MKRKKSPSKKHGRPSKLTESTQRKIIEAIHLGCTYSIAASYAGIHEATLFKWMARGREGDGGIYEDFYRAIKQAESVNAVRCLASIAQSARDGNWTASAWLLERRHGYIKDFPIQNIELTVDIQQSEVVTLIDEIREHALEDLIMGPVIDLDEE